MVLSSIGGMLLDKGVDLIGGLFTSGAEKGVEKVTQLVKDTTGIDLTNGDEVMAMTQEQVLQLKDIELKHKSEIIKYMVEEKRIYADNTKSARDMQTAAINRGGFHSYFTSILATILILFCLAYITAITFIEIPEKSVRFADTILGFLLGTVFATIVNFYWGSAMGRIGGANRSTDLVKK